MKKKLVSLLAGAAILGGCYKSPADLNFPGHYFSLTSPYVKCYNKEGDFTLYTMPHTEYYMDEAKYKISKLIKKVDEHLEMNGHFGLRGSEAKISILHKKDYYHVMKKQWPNNPKRWIGFGVYYIPNKSIFLRSCYRGFSKFEKRVFVHEYIHFRDYTDGYGEYLTDRETTKLTNEILGSPPRPFGFNHIL